MKFKVMRAIFRLLVLFSVALGAIGCSNCGDLDCVVSDELWVQFLSEENGESLTDGNDPPINESNFYCYREEEDGGRKQINLNPDGGGFYRQSFLESGTYYYSTLNKTDTVNVFGNARNTKCCGRIFEVDSIKVNGQVQELLEITLYR